VANSRWLAMSTHGTSTHRTQEVGTIVKLDGRTAVVIGGGSGIGRGIALSLGREGMHVAVADIDGEWAEKVAAEITDRGGAAKGFAVDGTDTGSLTELADATEKEFGTGPAVLSNNVGVACSRKLELATENEWAWAIEFNLMSAVRSVNVFLPRIRAHGQGGHIVNNAAVAALVAIVAPSVGSTGAPLGLYMASKHALFGYTETLRFELAPENIGVSMISTGTVASQLAKTSARNRPARYGGPFELPPRPKPAVKVEGPEPPSAEKVGDIVVRGIQANRLHILSHPEWRVRVENRYGELLRDFDFLDEFEATRADPEPSA
jgi:NAD(P)-dependent dehydrogenase (short-subunit alcohol dehydrogenase family)